MGCSHRALLAHTNLKKKDPTELELEPVRGSHFLLHSFYSRMPSCAEVRWMAGVGVATWSTQHV